MDLEMLQHIAWRHQDQAWHLLWQRFKQFALQSEVLCVCVDFRTCLACCVRFCTVAYLLGCREEACAQDKSTNGQMCARDSTFSCRFYRACIA